MNHLNLSDLQVFFGRLTENAASIYAKLPSANGWTDDVRLVGEVTGPVCEGSRTLPATVQLVFSGAEPTPLASASVPDPTFWSPSLPARYEVTVRITKGEKTLNQRKRRLALRRFGSQARSFTDQGRRVVVRGAADQHGLDQHDAEDWRDQRLHYLKSVNDQTDLVELAQQLDVAERAGFPVVVSVATLDATSIGQQLTLCASCAAVTLVVVEEEAVSAARDALAELVRSLSNLRLAAQVGMDQPLICPDWSTALVVRVDDRRPADLRAAEFAQPIVLRRRASTGPVPKELTAKRSLCEQLQREFTSAGDFAGYLIG